MTQGRIIPPARNVSLEEAIASVDFPVYGLSHPIHGLQLLQCSLSTKVSICYISDLYEQKLRESQKNLPRIRRVHPFSSVSSRKGSRERYEALLLPPAQDPGYKVVCLQELRGSDGVVREPLMQDVCPTILERQEIMIDDVHFIGNVKYYDAPYFHTFAYFYSTQTSLTVRFYGPDIEETFEILQALRVLNGRPVE
jgi:hypothetical protein